ncbi:MAG TPA: heavy metal-binding domain-containing protein, partial [Rhizomicrobium sp.]|nr:heavy metal-binding domain-containing protein [Rhizomicrobium sp.]
MMVDPATAKFQADAGGVTHYFCSAGCRSKFVADPAAYTKPSVAPPPANSDIIYTCPMHPQIRQHGPGSCPICGMALEPLTATADAGPNPERIDMSRRFWIALTLTLPVLVLEMGSHIPALDLGHTISMTTSIWIQFALSTPVVLWAGWPFFARGWASLRNRSL